MKKKLSLINWLNQVLRDGGSAFHAIHFDSLENCGSHGEVGLELVRIAIEVLISSRNHVCGNVGNSRELILSIFLPLGVSEEALPWNSDLWGKVKAADELPSLYIISGSQIFDEDMEEYRRPISIPIEGSGDVTAVFRSFRNSEAMMKSWEFTSGIYLIKKIES